MKEFKRIWDLLKKSENKKAKFGNSRSFSNRATRRKFSLNKQLFSVGGRKFYISVKERRKCIARSHKELVNEVSKKMFFFLTRRKK